jgi:hypothetical protein
MVDPVTGVDETRVRPQEIDFGPGSLDHRIGRWPHCPGIYVTPWEGFMPDLTNTPKPTPPKEPLVSPELSEVVKEAALLSRENSAIEGRISREELKSTPPPSDKGDGDIQTTPPLEQTENVVERIDLEGNALTAWQMQTSPDKFLIKAKRVVIEYMNSTGQSTKRLQPKELNIVWFSKTLQNWKALVSTVHKDGLYFEVTYNGHAGETYVDVYQKVTNFVIED